MRPQPLKKRGTDGKGLRRENIVYELTFIATLGAASRLSLAVLRAGLPRVAASARVPCVLEVCRVRCAVSFASARSCPRAASGPV